MHACACIYIHNKHTQYTHIYYVNKIFYFGLIVWQHYYTCVFITDQYWDTEILSTIKLLRKESAHTTSSQQAA